MTTPSLAEVIALSDDETCPDELCPFCGAYGERDPGWGGYIKCSNIECILGGPNGPDCHWFSARAWNTRTSAASLRDEGTPAAGWRERGEPDPHGTHYDGERALLAMGDLTDDELANAVFLYGDRPLSPSQMLDGKLPPIAYLTAAKDRIRWLSRALIAATQTAAQERRA